MRAITSVLALCCLASSALAAPVPARPAPASPPSKTGPAPLIAGAVRIDADGQVHLADQRLGRLPLPPPPRHLKVREVELGGRKLLHLKVSGPAGRAAELVLTAPPAAQVLFRGSTGPQGIDGEWSQHLRLDDQGLLTFQRREGLIRCDGGPVYLFPQLYDLKTDRFRPVSHLPRQEGLPELRPSRRPASAPAGEPLNTFRLIAASTQLGDDQQARNLSAPVLAEDGRPDTSWAESRGGSGQGEFLTAQAQASPYRLRALRIIPGDAASPRRFREVNRLRSLLLHLSPRQSYRIVFPRDPAAEPGRPEEPFWVELPAPVETTCASLVIEQVYPGSAAHGENDRTAIAELRFFTELEYGGGLDQLARDLDSPEPRRGDAAVTVLIRLGTQGIEVARRALPSATGAGLQRRVRVLAAAQEPAAAAPLVSALPRLPGASRTIALDALERLGSAAVDPLIALLTSAQPAGARADAAGLLGALGGSTARQALLDAAGSGPEPVRAGIVLGLGRLRSPEDLAAVLEAAEAAAGARRADLLHGLGRLGRLDPEATARRIAALWDRSPGFEERYRILTSLGRLAPAASLELLRKAAGSVDPVIRWIALEQARRVPGTAPVALLRSRLDDPYPPARTAAALGLVSRPADPAAGHALAAELPRERWPAVALAQAEALGWHCTGQGLSVLRKTVRQGPQAVDSRALNSLARCQPAGLADELLALARQRSQRSSLRVQALALLGPQLAASRQRQLIELFEEMRQGASRADADETVAISAAGALAQAGGAPAVEALSDALALDAHEPIRAAAALALGRLCARAGQEVLERARRDSSASVQRAAADAVTRCRGRWK